MTIGLYQNCRKKPFTLNGIAPVLGGPGQLRASFTGGSSQPCQALVTPVAANLAALVAYTPHVTASFAGDSIDSNDARTTGTRIISSPLAVELQTTHGLAGWASTQLSWGSFNSLGNLGSLAVGATKSMYGLLSAINTTSGTVNVKLDPLFPSISIEIRVYVNGTLTDTMTGISTNGASYTMSVGSVGTHSFNELRVDVKNVDLFATISSGLLVYVSGNEVGGVYGTRAGLGDIVSYAAFEDASWDASDFSGARYQTMSATSSGAGAAQLMFFVPTRLTYTSQRLLCTTGLHHCEVDELCHTWVD